MSMYKSILATIDLASGHELVAGKGAELARTFGAKFSMVHVVRHSFLNAASASPGSVGGFGMPSGSTEKEIAQQVDNARAALQRLAEECGQPDAEKHVWVASSVKAAVIEVLKNNEIDLMVVGSHQRGLLDRMLVNSVGYQLLRNAPRDAWVVDIPVK